MEASVAVLGNLNEHLLHGCHTQAIRLELQCFQLLVQVSHHTRERRRSTQGKLEGNLAAHIAECLGLWYKLADGGLHLARVAAILLHSRKAVAHTI